MPTMGNWATVMTTGNHQKVENKSVEYSSMLCDMFAIEPRI